MLRFDSYAALPGLQAAAETYENEFRWGPTGMGLLTNGWIASGAVDLGNTPTYELRPGLLLGKVTATGQWSNYVATNTDGSQVAAGVLIAGMRMQDFQGVNQQKFYAILVGGPVQAGKLLNLDYMARQQMANGFRFDDDLPGQGYFGFRTFISKAASFTAAVADNNTMFDNLGATGSIVATLPPIQAGLRFGFRCLVAQTIVVTSNEGSNIVIDTSLTASTATLAGRIGTSAHFYVPANLATPKWVIEYTGAQGGANETIL